MSPYYTPTAVISSYNYADLSVSAWVDGELWGRGEVGMLLKSNCLV
jgi:hypothetical protein